MVDQFLVNMPYFAKTCAFYKAYGEILSKFIDGTYNT